MNESISETANEAINSQSAGTATAANEAAKATKDGFPLRGEPFDSRYLTFSAAIDQLKKAAVVLNGFDLQVNLKWKRDPYKATPPPDQIEFPELPRYVSEDVSWMVLREEWKQTLTYKRNQEIRAGQKRPSKPADDAVPILPDEDAELIREMEDLKKFDREPKFPSFMDAGKSGTGPATI
jgi:hypothetical protein